MNLNLGNSFDDSSSSYHQEDSKRYDPEVVKKLLGFIEMTFERKLGNLEKIDRRNTKNLKIAKKQLKETEKKVDTIQRELNKGA